jgi:hypothetical protein
VKDSVHLLEQLGYTENEQSLGKVKLSFLLERKFGDKFIVVPYNKKLFVTLIGLAREEQADCPLPETLVINYSHSRNPPCAPAWTHGQIQAPREPPN